MEIQHNFNSKSHIVVVGDKHVFPGFLTPVLTQLSFQSQQLLFPHASEIRAKIQWKESFVSTWYQTHNHKVMSQTCSPLSHQGRLMA